MLINLDKFNFQSDLAIEAHDLLKGKTDKEISGVKEEKKEYKNAVVRTVKILNKMGEAVMKKQQGTYVTIECPAIRESNMNINKEVSEIFAEQLKLYIEKLGINKMDNILAVGLGNWDATPDALGPRTISNIYVTRHLIESGYKKGGSTQSVSTLSPGVLGVTGIETAEIIKGVVEKTKPSLLIVIDSLAASDLNRINTTIQITDTGINPGSGIGNTRKGINKEFLGIPVIAIGVPTVVRAAVLIFEAFNMLMDKDSIISDNLNQSLAENTLEEVMKPFGGDLTVTPKEVDDLISNTSKLLSNGINKAFHDNSILINN